MFADNPYPLFQYLSSYLKLIVLYCAYIHLGGSLIFQVCEPLSLKVKTASQNSVANGSPHLRLLQLPGVHLWFAVDVLHSWDV